MSGSQKSGSGVEIFFSIPKSAECKNILIITYRDSESQFTMDTLIRHCLGKMLVPTFMFNVAGMIHFYGTFREIAPNEMNIQKDDVLFVVNMILAQSLQFILVLFQHNKSYRRINLNAFTQRLNTLINHYKSNCMLQLRFPKNFIPTINYIL